MNKLPFPARVYLGVIWVLALAILFYASTLLASNDIWYWSILLIVAFVFADYFEVLFEVQDRTIAMTTAETLTIFLVATQNFNAIFIIASGTLVVELLRGRKWFNIAFNIASRVITVFTMCLCYNAIHQSDVAAFSSPIGIIAFIMTALSHYIVNTLLVGLIVALATHAPVGSVYRESYKLVQWIHLLTLPIGALMAAHWQTNRWLLVFDIVVLLIAQRSFIMVAQLQTESHQRKELAEERGQLLEELRLRQEELIRTSKLAALGTFSAGIAHEFGTLLAVVDGQAQVGLMTDDASEMRQSLTMTLTTARRGRTITQGLLTFARQGESQKIMTQLQEVIEDTLNMIQQDFEQARVQIIRQLQPLPPTSCDPGQIMQVLLNILGNARDALQDCGGGTITFTTSHENNQIVMAITDNGSGIAPALLEQLFQPFVTTKGAGGTGLGLAICYGIIEDHRGHIKADSIVGQGTTMTIRLPVIEKYEPGIIVTHQDSIRIGSATPVEPLRI